MINFGNKNTALSSKTKNKLLATTMLTAAGLMAFTSTARAMDDFTTPEGEQVVGGSASFDRPSDGLLNINQDTNRVIINWDHFNIGKSATTQFFQPGTGSLAVNRVTGGNADPTKILGSLLANGKIMVIDRNGVFFGQDSHVDVGSIIVSTGDVSDAAVMNGDDKFEFSNFGSGKVDLQGQISVADAGLAAFVSPFISNSGVINAKMGTVAMAAGDKVTLDLYGDDLIEIAVNDKIADALLQNSGTINANGGNVIITAQAAKDAIDDVINMGGVVDVSSVSQQGGKIVIAGGEQGAVAVSGNLNATGVSGGDVTVTGQYVQALDGANIDASGTQGNGGTIKFGGDYQGGGDTPTSDYAYIDQNAVLNANAGQDGNGGKVTVWSNKGTGFYGLINAKGGSNSGNGGFVETSGEEHLEAFGSVDASAVNGLSGEWLLDPDNLTVIAGAAGPGGYVDASGIANDSVGDAALDLLVRSDGNLTNSTVTNGNIQASLNVGTNVVLRTRNTGTEDGDINVNANIDKTAGGNAILRMEAHDEININNAITSTFGKLDVQLVAGNDIGFPVAIGDNNINILANISTNGGAFTANADNGFNTGGDFVINTKGGAVNVNAVGDILLDGSILTGGGVANFTGANFTLDDVGVDKIDTDGGNVTINAGYTRVSGFIDASNGASGGKILINNTGIFDTKKIGVPTSNTLITSGTGTITLNQNAGGKIQEAIDAVQNTGTGLNTITVGAGTYNENVKVYENNFLLKGANVGKAGYGARNPESVINGGVGPSGTAYALKISSNNVTVDGFKLDADGNGVWLDGSGGPIGGFAIQNNVITTNNTQDSQDAGILGNNASNIGVYSNKLDVVGNDGMTFAGGGNIVVGANRISTTDGAGIYLGGVNGSYIYNNSISNTGLSLVDGDGISVNNGTGSNTVIANYIGYTDFGVTPGAAGNIRGDGVQVVNTAGALITGNLITNVTGNGVFVDPSPGTIVSGNIINNTVLDGVHIQDSAGSQVLGNLIGLLGGPNSIGSGAGGGDGIFVTNSDGTTIQGNYTKNTHYNGPARKGSGILVTNSDNVLIGGGSVGQGNDIALAGSDGIVIRTDGGTADNNTIQSNVIHGAAGSRTGVYTEFATNTTVKNNIINGTGRYAGIFLNGGFNQTITGNTLNHNDEDGILVWNAGGVNLIDGNIIDNTGENKKPSDGVNRGDGISVLGTSGLTVSNNKIGQNGGGIHGDGVHVVNSGGAQIKTNTISYTDGDGIFLDPSDNSVISGNTIDYANGNSIEVQASNNVQVLNNKIGQGSGGYINPGFGTGDGILIAGGSNNAIVDGNLVATDGRGVDLQGGNGHEVKNNTITTVAWVNGADEGIFALNTSNANIHDNTVTTADNDGISAIGGSNLKVSNNKVHAATDQGIDVENVATALISGNVVENTYSDGIFAYNDSGLTVSGNWVGYSDNLGTVSLSNIGGDGIDVEESDGAVISGNHVTKTLGNGIFVDPTDNALIQGNIVNNAALAGIKIVGGNNNTIDNNSVYNSGTVNIFGDVGSNLHITNNASGGSFYGIYVDNLTGNSNISTNSVDGAGVNGITVTGSVNVLVGGNDGVIPGHQGDSGNFVTNSGENGIELGYNGAGNVVSNNTVAGFGHDGIYVHNNTGGVQVTINEVYNGGYGFNGGNGIDLQDITGGAYVYYNVVHDISDALTPYATGENNGILAKNVAGLNITQNGVGYTDIYYGLTLDTFPSINGDGIDVENSPSAQITNNHVANTVGNGIFVDPSDFSTVSGNTINYAAGNAIDIENSDYVSVLNNIIGNLDLGLESGGSGDGVHIGNVGGTSDYSIVNGNTITTDGRGVALIGGTGHNVGPNTITTVSNSNSNDEGIYANGVTNTNIHDNNVVSADNAGIRVVNGSTNITVNNNGVHAATEQGIDIEGGSNVFVTNNTVENTSLDGILANTVTGLFVTGNIVHNTGGDGIDVETSNNAQITGNKVGYLNDGVTPGGSNNIAGDGIHVINSNFANISLNKVTKVAGNGIFIDPSDWDVISGNDLDWIALNSIDVENSDHVSVLNNTIGQGSGGFFASGDGIHIAGGSDFATVQGNNVKTDGRGVSVLGGDGHVVNNNTITTVSTSNSDDEGIYAFNTTNIDITNNHLTPSIDNVGIRVNGGSNADVLGNDIHNSQTYGIWLQGVAKALVDSNLVDNVLFSGTGVQVDGGSNITVTNNTIYNVWNGIWASLVDTLWIDGNTIDANSTTNAPASGNRGIHVNDSKNVQIGEGNFSGNNGNNIDDFAYGIEALNNTGHTYIDGNDITDANYGIYASNDASLQITDNDINGRTASGRGANAGIHVDTSPNALIGGSGDGNTVHKFLGNGIELINSNSSTISYNTVYDVTGNGIFVDPSSFVDVGYNDIDNVGGDGIHAEDAYAIDIFYNDVYNADGDGIQVINGDYANIYNNDVDEVDDNGIRVSDSDYANIYNNDINKDNLNTNNSLDNGILVENSYDVDIYSNDIDDSVLNGIYVNNGDSVWINGNTVNDSGQNGILVKDSDNAEIYSNNVNHSGQNGIYVDPSSFVNIGYNIVNNSKFDGIRVDGGVYDNIYYNDVDNSGDDGIDVNDNDYVEIYNNDIDNTGGNGIEVSDSYDADIRDNDVDETDGDGINVQNSNYADIYGNEINRHDASANTDDDGIEVGNSYGVSIHNNTVDDSYDNGIYLWNSNNSAINWNHVEDSKHNGIFVKNSDYVDVLHNTVLRSGQHGIFVDPSDYIEIGYNDIVDSGWDGIHVDNGTYADIYYNDIDNSGDDGIDVNNNDQVEIYNNDIDNTGGNGIEVSDSYNADIRYNDVDETDGDGINVQDSDYADIYYNEINRHNPSANTLGDGIEVGSSSHVDVTHNTVDDSFDNGVYLWNSDYSTINWNHIEDTKENGIFVKNSDHVDVLHNTIDRSGHNGIFVDPSDYVDIGYNTIHDSGWNGILLQDGIYGDIFHNHVGDSGDNGIEVRNNYGVDVTNNYVHDSDDSGIDIDNSYDADVLDNEVHDSGGDGIEVDDSNYADVRNNEVFDSGDDGIDVDNSDYVDVNDNHVHTADHNGIEVTNSFDADIINNRVHYTGDDGIYADNDFGADIRWNEIHNTGDDGIDVRNSDWVDVVGNDVWSTWGDGIQVRNSDHADINWNKVKFSHDDGIDVEDSNFADIFFNWVSFVNHNGIEVTDSDFLEIEYNNVWFAGDNGIYVDPSDYVEIDGNHVFYSGDDGIKVDDGSFITVKNNLVQHSGDDGIDVDGSQHVFILDNTVFDSGDDGIVVDADKKYGYIYSPNDITIDGNSVDDSGDDGIQVSGSKVNLILTDNHVTDSVDNGILLIAKNKHGFGGPSEDGPPRITLLTDTSEGDQIISDDDEGCGGDCGSYEGTFNSYIANNIVENSGSNGLYVKGYGHEDVILKDNFFIDNPVGARFESGKIDISDLDHPNHFIVTGSYGIPAGYSYVTGMQFDLAKPSRPDSLTIVGLTLGSTVFDGYGAYSIGEGYYVRFEDGAILDCDGNVIVIDGTKASFDGFVPEDNLDGQGHIPADILADIEDRLWDADDPLVNGRGQIFVGTAPDIEIAQEDIFNRFGNFTPGPGGLNITLLGLPGIPGGGGGVPNFNPSTLNAINTFAGGGDDGNLTPDELNAIETAAGGGGEGGKKPQSVTCWNDATSQAYGGTTVNYSYLTDPDATIADAAACSGPAL